MKMKNEPSLQSNKYDDSTKTTTYDKIESKLLIIISQEVKKDGGASLVRDLIDYNHQIKSLLKRCNQTKKLLTFLEMYPSIFEVNRDVLPHVVYLVSTYNDSNFFMSKEGKEHLLLYIEQYDTKSLLKKKIKQASEELETRIRCVLKSERSKKIRRYERRHCSSSTTSDQNDNVDVCTSSLPFDCFGVSSTWLLKQSKTQLHYYLRLCNYYNHLYLNRHKDVQIVGTPEWLQLVESKFYDIIKTFHFCELQHDNSRVHLVINNIDGNDESLDTVRHIALKLKEKVEEDAGTHISLSLLLNRYPELCQLLSGLDLVSIKAKHEDLFQDVNIYTKYNQVFLQSKVTKPGRMEVDETGLFSVASSKWGKTFASLMSYHCRQTLSKDPKETVAIDLTASVGGFVLPFTKSFSHIIAIEIDEHRSILCQRNMVTQGVSNQVQILNQDSVETIPLLATTIIKNQPKIVICDPPWNGKYYKLEKKEITMGKWSMVQVLKRISDYLSPTITGIRMPVTFDVDKFFQSLKDANVSFTSLQIKKAGPQLFIIVLL